MSAIRPGMSFAGESGRTSTTIGTMAARPIAAKLVGSYFSDGLTAGTIARVETVPISSV